MPARDGTRPSGQGSRTGRGIGNCKSTRAEVNRASFPGTRKALGWGFQVWGAAIGRIFGRRRAYRTARK